MFAWAIIVIFIAHFIVVSSSCPAVCSCAPDPPQCPSEVGLQRDACDCCLVCARQLNEDCSRSEPCDHSKGLECNYRARHGATTGICRAGAAIPTCCLSVSHRFPKRVLRLIRRYEVQDRSGHCEINALILHFKGRKLCAHPKLERLLKKMRKRRVKNPPV